MSKYMYSIVRCLPDPRTGEFVNVGAIAGDPAAGDWAVRRLSNTERIKRFASPAAIDVADRFLVRVSSEIAEAREVLEAEGTHPLGEGWLSGLHHDHRNIVQLSPPTPIVAGHAEAALDVIFRHMIIDPASQPRQVTVGKDRVVQDLRKAYQEAAIPAHFLRPRAEVFIGDKLHSMIDIAIANGRTVQLAQGWSFRVTGVERLVTQVKAWGFALERLRTGDQGRLVDALGRLSEISSNVDLRVVIATPETAQQEAAYEEAHQVFRALRAQVHSVEEVSAVSAQAVNLLHRST
ncbi:hypothetical protein Sru01_50740 [Sphaerisporangium rufum]|uniref:DUF3037 domain-containing protein n=1 Tax=Sphaerisporangium rufum TaxID=1381558 RepID=A0A919RA35_9ACTN|nr:DUF3037 domain-containing protein [Sphaerisporangium rufum]GII80092.1 hypothetical protein Sru01_50740 [Sphaerisporangium rufum]